MRVNFEKLQIDLIKEIYNQEMTANELCKDLNVSYQVYKNIGESADIRVGNLLKFINWLGKDANTYIQ